MRECLLLVLLALSGCSFVLPETPDAPRPTPVAPSDLPTDGPVPQSEPQVDACAELRARVAELEARPEPQPVVIERPTTEADYWDSLAALVESGRIADTDVVCKLVELLKADGLIVDDSRIGAWKVLGGRQQIGDGNRASVASQLRGQ